MCLTLSNSPLSNLAFTFTLTIEKCEKCYTIISIVTISHDISLSKDQVRELITSLSTEITANMHNMNYTEPKLILGNVEFLLKVSDLMQIGPDEKLHVDDDFRILFEKTMIDFLNSKLLNNVPSANIISVNVTHPYLWKETERQRLHHIQSKSQQDMNLDNVESKSPMTLNFHTIITGEFPLFSGKEFQELVHKTVDEYSDTFILSLMQELKESGVHGNIENIQIKLHSDTSADVMNMNNTTLPRKKVPLRVRIVVSMISFALILLIWFLLAEKNRRSRLKRVMDKSMRRASDVLTLRSSFILEISTRKGWSRVSSLSNTSRHGVKTEELKSKVEDTNTKDDSNVELNKNGSYQQIIIDLSELKEAEKQEPMAVIEEDEDMNEEDAGSYDSLSLLGSITKSEAASTFYEEEEDNWSETTRVSKSSFKSRTSGFKRRFSLASMSMASVRSTSERSAKSDDIYKRRKSWSAMSMADGRSVSELSVKSEKIPFKSKAHSMKRRMSFTVMSTFSQGSKKEIDLDRVSPKAVNSDYESDESTISSDGGREPQKDARGMNIDSFEETKTQESILRSSTKRTDGENTDMKSPKELSSMSGGKMTRRFSSSETEGKASRRFSLGSLRKSSESPPNSDDVSKDRRKSWHMVSPMLQASLTNLASDPEIQQILDEDYAEDTDTAMGSYNSLVNSSLLQDTTQKQSIDDKGKKDNSEDNSMPNDQIQPKLPMERRKSVSAVPQQTKLPVEACRRLSLQETQTSSRSIYENDALLEPFKVKVRSKSFSMVQTQEESGESVTLDIMDGTIYPKELHPSRVGRSCQSLPDTGNDSNGTWAALLDIMSMF